MIPKPPVPPLIPLNLDVEVGLFDAVDSCLSKDYNWL